jgi:O-antigen/teichoic acid export membrane protein
METAQRGKKWPLVSALMFVLAYFVARAGLKMDDAGTGLRVFFALLPVIPFVFLLVGFARGIREMDELERRIQLEALSLSFPLAMILLLTLGLLEIAIELPSEDLSYRHVWAILPTLYFICLAIAKRRYQ